MRRLLPVISLFLLLGPALALESPAEPLPDVEQRLLTWHGCEVCVITVPKGAHVVPVAARPGKKLEKFVHDAHALAGINGGYFNHSDGWAVSHVLAGGRALTEPEKNRALADNQLLKPYLPRILDHRAEWRHVTSSAGSRWLFAHHDAPLGPGEKLVDALQAGPLLFPTPAVADEAFTVPNPGRKGAHDGIASHARAARSALGLCADGRLLLVGVGAPGLDLVHLSALMHDLKAVSALNLDGGSSTGLVWREDAVLQSFHGPHTSALLNSALLFLR